MKSFLLCCSLAMAVWLSPVQASAKNWFENFSDSVIIHNSASWSLQQQGHYAAGGFSMRFDFSQPKQLFHISTPRISGGCAGIDSFWGGFSFLDPEYLIQMFENIVAVAPAYAFQLALQSMCASCSDVMATLQELAAIANSLAVDDCAAAHAIASAGVSALAGIFETKSNKGETEGSGSDWHKALKEFRGKANKFGEEVQRMLKYKFCDKNSTVLGKSLCERFYGTSGTIWSKALEMEAYKPSSIGEGNSKEKIAEIIEVFQSLMGDISITFPQDMKESDGAAVGNANDDPKMSLIKYQAGCAHASIKKLMQAMTSRPISEAETPEFVVLPANGDSKACIGKEIPSEFWVGKKVSDAIDDIVDKMEKDRTASLKSTTIDVISKNTLPIYQILNLYSLRNRVKGTPFLTSGEKNDIIKLASTGHAAYILLEHLDRMNELFTDAASELAPAIEAMGKKGESYAKDLATFNQKYTLLRNDLFAAVNEVFKDYDKNLIDFTRMATLRKNLEKAVFSAQSFY